MDQTDEDPRLNHMPGPFGYECKVLPDGTPLSELPDRRDEVPYIIQFLNDEQKVINVEDVARPTIGIQLPDTKEFLAKVHGVVNSNEIGVLGPGSAAESTESMQNEEQANLLGALFGRDSLHAATELYQQYPALLETTVIRLAELQGFRDNLRSDEEPGRIIHWAPDPRSSIAKQVTEVNGWEWPNYGSIDSTPMFIRAVIKLSKDKTQILNRTYLGRDGDYHTIRHALKEAVAWFEKKLANNPEGLLEFRVRPGYERICWDQAWKDTPESYVHADGSYANHHRGIASIEVQALAYDTLIDLADFYQDEDKDRSNLLRHQAEKLKQIVLKYFWVEDEIGGYLALGTDRDGNDRIRPMQVRSSNMGHALHLLNDEQKEAVIRCLFSEEMLDQNGIRTLSSKEKRFVPMSYHCGSVWPWDNGVIAKELELAGFKLLAKEIDRRVKRSIESVGMFLEFIPGINAQSPEDMMIKQVVDVYDGEREHYSNSYRIQKPAQLNQLWTATYIHRINSSYDQTELSHMPASDSTHKVEVEILNSVNKRI